MKLQIGRFGEGVVSGEVQGAESSGAAITIAGRTAYADFEQSLALRQQLLGYVDNPDETFVPVVWDEYPSVTGFYRVLSAKVDSPRRLAPRGKINFSVELERVRGYASALVEVSQLGANRIDERGWPTVYKGFGLPGAARNAIEHYRSGGVRRRNAVAVSFERPTSDGHVLACVARSVESVIEYYVDPASHYQGAATLRVGNPERVAVGQQIQNTPDAWSLSNGMLEVRPRNGFADGLILEYRMWATDAWTAWETAAISYDLASVGAPHTITVMRNSPEEVRLRLLTVIPGSTTPITVDLGLRRGARYVSVLFTSLLRPYIVELSNFALFDDAYPSGWSVTGDNGLTMFVASTTETGLPPTFRPIETTGEMWSVCLGYTDSQDVGGIYDDVARSIGEWFWDVSERQAVVAQ